MKRINNGQRSSRLCYTLHTSSPTPLTRSYPHDIIMSGYDFSQLYHSSILAYSPGSTFIATAHQNRIIIRSTTTLQIVRTWLCMTSTPIASSSKSPVEFGIDSLQWSDDGSYILAMARGIVWIFALAEEGNGQSGEVAVIGEGLEGCVKAEWGSRSRDILIWSDYGVCTPPSRNRRWDLC